MAAWEEAIKKERALLRREMQKVRAKLDEYRRIHLENVRRNEDLQDELARATGEIRALRETIRQMKG